MTLPHQRWSVFPQLFNLDELFVTTACDCLDEWNTEKTILCDLWGYEASTGLTIWGH